MTRALAPWLLLTLLLTGCLGTSIPTQHDPSCSWDSAVPANSESICTVVFRTLQALASAEQTGNNRAVRRLVSKPRVQDRILRYGSSLRRQGVKNLHIVPSITLDQLRPGHIGAGFYLHGEVKGGRVNSPMTMELQVHGSRATVINDQAGQGW